MINIREEANMLRSFVGEWVFGRCSSGQQLQDRMTLSWFTLQVSYHFKTILESRWYFGHVSGDDVL